MGLAALGITIATAGTAAPILAAGAGLIGQGAGTIVQAVQADKNVSTVGSGAQDLYATDNNNYAAMLIYKEYPADSVIARDGYFALNGYAGRWCFIHLPVSAEQRPVYWYARGRGKVKITTARSNANAPVTATELQDAVDEEIGNGVYWWYRDILSPLTPVNK
jgi:hypothetical protein